MRVPSFAKAKPLTPKLSNEDLALIAEQNWHAAGHSGVRFWVHGRVIESNLVDGLPPVGIPQLKAA